MSVEIHEETPMDLADDAIRVGEKEHNNDLLVFGHALKAILEGPVPRVNAETFRLCEIVGENTATFPGTDDAELPEDNTIIVRLSKASTAIAWLLQQLRNIGAVEPKPLDEKGRKLLGRGISRAYHAAMATPPFYKGSSTDKLIAIMESWGVDFSRVDLKQFENIRMED